MAVNVAVIKPAVKDGAAGAGGGGSSHSATGIDAAASEGRVHIIGKRYLPALEMLRFYWKPGECVFCGEVMRAGNSCLVVVRGSHHLY